MKRNKKNNTTDDTSKTPVIAGNISEASENLEEEIVDIIEDTVNAGETNESTESAETGETNETGESTESAKSNEATAASNEHESEKVEAKLTRKKTTLTKQISDVIELKEVNKTSRKKRRKKILIGVLIALIGIVGISSFLICTKPGKQVLMKLGINIGSKIWAITTKDFEEEETLVKVPDTDDIEQEDIDSKAPEIDPVQIKWPEHPGSGMHVDGIYNILLIGEEAIGSSDGKGRTDVIVIATLDTLGKKVKLTSIMRDSYVQIPGYQDNKINSAYEKGGIDLLYKTIALNYDIHLDGCVKVNFKNFEKIIDKLGGLDLTLTKEEAHYLDTTNYISNKKYRTVKEGKQHMNGNQVLGYSRVRKRATITGNNNDYGRTDRHRLVLNAIFEKYKSKSKVDLASLMFSILPMITTDIDSKSFETMLNSFIMMGPINIEQLRIPANGTFKDNLKVRGMSVLIIDLDENVKIIHNFIFGDNIVYSSDADVKAEPSVTGVAKK